MTDTNVRTDRWRFDPDLLAIVEEGYGGLALFEVLSATTFAQARAAALAPELVEALRRYFAADAEYANAAGTDDALEAVHVSRQYADAKRNLRALLTRLDQEVNREA